MTARPNPASPRAGVMRLSLLTHRTNRATANCPSANPLWVTQTSHDLHPGNRGQTETQSGYPVGGQVPVFYDPSNPRDSALVPGGSSGNWYFLLLGGTFVAAGMIGLLRHW